MDPWYVMHAYRIHMEIHIMPIEQGKMAALIDYTWTGANHSANID